MLVTVRDAAQSDMEAVQRIYAFHVSHSAGTFEETPPTLEEMSDRWAAVLGHGLPYLVACTDDQVVGFCYATPFRPRAAYRFTVEDSVYVAPEFAGRGVGTALLSELIRRVTHGPWQQMVAVIGDSGNMGSRMLHSKLGFRHVGTLDKVGSKFGGWLDVVMMQRSVADPEP